MKKLFPLLFLCFSLSVFSQATKESYPQDVGKRHELTMNALTLIVSEWIDVSYEYLINEESSFGVDLQFGLDCNDNFETYRTFSITPNYRRYFSNKYARGFFIEAFGMLYTYKDFYSIYDSVTPSTYVDRTETDFSLGVSVGGKWVTKSGFITEIFAGVGRNLLNDDSIEVAGRFGVSLGYRF